MNLLHFSLLSAHASTFLPIRRLTSIVGRKEALRLLALSPVILPDEALRIGLADRVVEPFSGAVEGGPTYEEYSLQVCRDFLQPYLEMKYPLSLRAIKRAVGAVEVMDATNAMNEEVEAFSSRWFSEDNRVEMAKR